MKNVYILCGIPGSGKSTWVLEQLRRGKCAIWCSRDFVRFGMVKSDEPYFSREIEVFNRWIANINEAITYSEYEDIYVDATHLTEKARKKTVSLLAPANYFYVAFDVPLNVCLERNAKRKGREKVPEDVIINMFNTYTIPKGDNVIIINEKGERV